MNQIKEIKITLPKTLLNDVDDYVQKNNINQKIFIEKAVQNYLKVKKKEILKKNLKEGYTEVSELNRELAEKGLKHDVNILTYYEEILQELTENV